ncbi:MAG: MarR family transcriptional regulator [Gallionella sp.]|nr:MAG: MarR family transcriptional regulator [Gallionella sp.]
MKTESPPRLQEEDYLRLEHQLCFPLYAASRLVTRRYQPLLDPLGLTYPQYIVLLILWEDSSCSVSHIGERALLNSNTLTPLLKRLEQLGYVRRVRSAVDERVVEISLTDAGAALKARCACVPERLMATVNFPPEKGVALKGLLDELIHLLANLPDEMSVPMESQGVGRNQRACFMKARTN